MSVDNRIPSNFVWENRHTIGNAIAYAPFVIEGGKLASQIAFNPKGVKDKIYRAKNYFISSFTRTEGESQREFCLRLVRNAAITVSLLSIFSGLVAGAVLLLPASLSIGVALSAIFSLSNIFLNADDFAKGFKQKVQAVKKLFTIQSEKPRNREILRVVKNVILATVCTAAVLGVIGLVVYIVSQLALGTVSIWSPYDLLPFQTTTGVFLEYAAVGAAHGALAARHAIKNHKGAAAFHLINGIISFVFPTLMLHNNPTEPLRLHHSFLGLALALIPFRPVQMLASIITLDSLRNSFYFQYGDSIQNQYDFQNILVHERTDAITNTIAASALEDLSSRISNKSKS